MDSCTRLLSSDIVALPKILALGERQVEEGKVISAIEAIRVLRDRLAQSLGA